MIVIGLTGGTGSGKGRVCEIFLSYGIPSIDTDKVSRLVCEAGKPCLIELVDHFGATILNSDGSLDRKKLASVAFSDGEKHKALNAITHKYILAEVRDWLSVQRADGKEAAIVDAPLLYESSFDKECDIIIATTASKETRVRRILERDGIDLDAALTRISKQGDDKFYTERADFVVTNDGELFDLTAQIDGIYKKLFGEDSR